MKREKLCKGDKLLLLVALIVVVVGIVIGLLIKDDTSGDAGSNPATLPELSIGGDLDFEERQNGGISIPTSQEYNIIHGTTEQEIPLSNPSTNTCDFIISIYLSDGSKLYTSDRVCPGDSVTSVQFSQPLKSGVYRNVVVVYDCYKHGTQEPLTRVEVVVELNCM